MAGYLALMAEPKYTHLGLDPRSKRYHWSTSHTCFTRYQWAESVYGMTLIAVMAAESVYGMTLTALMAEMAVMAAESM